MVVSAALNGVLTDPKMFPDVVIPVTPAEMAQAASEAFDAGASVAHIHFRDQRAGKGHLPTWDPEIAGEIAEAIRARVPEMLLNFTTGTIGEGPSPMGGGPLGPVGGPVACLAAGKPEIAAMNSGSLNYLKVKTNGDWAWPPMVRHPARHGQSSRPTATPTRPAPSHSAPARSAPARSAPVRSGPHGPGLSHPILPPRLTLSHPPSSIPSHRLVGSLANRGRE